MNIKTLITPSEYKRTLDIAKQLLHDKRYKEYYIFRKLACCAIFANGKEGFIHYDMFLSYIEQRIDVCGYNVENAYDLKRRALWGDRLFGIDAKIILYGTERRVEDALINKWIWVVKMKKY